MFKKKNIADTTKSDWRESGSFMRKPERGWLHPDHAVGDGVSYAARYVGCVKILQSMRTISYEDRGQLVREAIAKCCDKAHMIKHKKKKVPQEIQKVLGDIFVGYCGEDVTVNISKTSIKVTLTKTGVLICDHDMTNISFASAGEKEYASLVAYVAKDTVFERACFVMECEHGLTADLIHTIGQAFELKYKDFLNKPPQATTVPEKFSQPIFGDAAPEHPSNYAAIQGRGKLDSENSYESYSHLKRDQNAGPNQVLPHYDKLNQVPQPSDLELQFAAGAGYSEPGKESQFAAVYDNPIASPTTREHFGIDTNSNHVQATYDNPKNAMEVNGALPPGPTAATPGASGWTRFDVEDQDGYLVPSPVNSPTASFKGQNPFHYASLASSQDSTGAEYQRPSPSMYHPPSTKKSLEEQNPLYKQVWFHGPITRVEAEMVIENNGDYLVRESSNSPGQYVLSGMQQDQHRHLLLVDPQGQVRTKDRTFNSVEELIAFHTKHSLPIISGGSDVYLERPVSRQKHKDPKTNSFKI